MLPAMLAGYLFLLIFRPYEYWPMLGTLRIERIYMIVFIIMAVASDKKRWIKSPINACVALFVAALMLSGLFAKDVEEAWDLVVDYMKYVVFYILVVLSIRDKKDLRNVLLFFLGVMFVYVSKSAWEFFVNGRYNFTMGIKRMTGVDLTYGAPNSFSASICYSLPMLWAMIRFGDPRGWVRYGFWAYGALALVAIVYTGSRSGMVTLLLFFMLAVLSSSKKFMAVALLGTVVAVGWQFMPDDLQDRFKSTYEKGHGPAGADESAEGRMAGFLQGVSVFTQHPVFGIGPANFQFSWPGVVKGYNAHNLYGQTMGELGIVGVGSFAALLFVVFRTSRRVMAGARKEYPDIFSRQKPKEAEKGAKSGHKRKAAPASAPAVHAPAASRTAGPRSSRTGDVAAWMAGHPAGVPAPAQAAAGAAAVAGSAREALPVSSPGAKAGTAARAGADTKPGKSSDPFAPAPSPDGTPVPADGVHRRAVFFYALVAQAVSQTLILMLFKGWGDHNLYRYTWLWMAAVAVLTGHLFLQEAKEHGKR